MSSLIQMLELLTKPQWLPHVVLMISVLWPNDRSSPYFFPQLQQKSRIWSECLRSLKVLFAWWDFLTFDLGRNAKKRNIHRLQKKYGSSEQPQGDAWIQECADFRCGEWQPWWSADCCSVVIENTFPSAGETRSVSMKFGEPQQM